MAVDTEGARRWPEQECCTTSGLTKVGVVQDTRNAAKIDVGENKRRQTCVLVVTTACAFSIPSAGEFDQVKDLFWVLF